MKLHMVSEFFFQLCLWFFLIVSRMNWCIKGLRTSSSWKSLRLLGIILRVVNKNN